MELIPTCELVPLKHQTADSGSYHCTVYTHCVFVLIFYYEGSLECVALGVTES